MFYFLSKTISMLAMPITWLILLLLYALFKKAGRGKNVTIALTLSLLMIAGNPVVSNKIMLWWEVPAVEFSDIQAPYEVGIILSGAVNIHKSPKDRIHVRQGSDRMLHAADLYHRNLVKRLIITGAHPEPLKNSEAEDMKKILIKYQIPDSAIILETEALNTRENALYTQKILSERFPLAQKPLLITSAFHMRRSIACFQKIGVETTPFSTDFYTYDEDNPPLQVGFWPTERSFWVFSVWVHEVVGLIVYKLMGYA